MGLIMIADSWQCKEEKGVRIVHPIDSYCYQVASIIHIRSIDLARVRVRYLVQRAEHQDQHQQWSHLLLLENFPLRRGNSVTRAHRPTSTFAYIPIYILVTWWTHTTLILFSYLMPSARSTRYIHLVAVVWCLHRISDINKFRTSTLNNVDTLIAQLRAESIEFQNNKRKPEKPL